MLDTCLHSVTDYIYLKCVKYFTFEKVLPIVSNFFFQVKASIEKKLGKKSIYNAISFRAVETKILYIAKVSFIILFYIP